MTYINSHTTLEDIGLKHDVSKQRVWQIVRYSKLGKGDYYLGLKRYNECYKEYSSFEKDPKIINNMVREWMQLNSIRLIKTKQK